MVPGDYPQVEKDLASFPEPVLDLLDRYGVRVAVLDEQQSLFDSPAIRTFSESEYSRQRVEANQVIKAQLSVVKADTAAELAEKLTHELREEGLEFHLALTQGGRSKKQIAEHQGIPPQHFQDWSNSFDELNQDLPQGLLIMPHTYHKGEPIAHNQFRNSKHVTAEFVEKSLGLNRAEDRLVLLHRKYTPENAAEVGNYRLSIHEMGHALDHLLDRVTGFPGLGTAHRMTVDALYERDLRRAEDDGVGAVFTSDRASEDVREYFAEAIEAYLTFPEAGEGEIFRTENSNPGLKQRSPELYNYVDALLSRDYAEVSAPGLPPRPPIPYGVPDPDTQVYLF